MGASKEQRAETLKRRVELFKLKRAGVDWDTIAKSLGYASKGAAAKDYRRVLDELAKEIGETAEEMRTLDMARLERMLRGLWSAGATAGNTKAVDSATRVIGMRARLGGYDTPPELAERIEQETIARIVPQMALVWSKVLDGLGPHLAPEGRALVPALMDEAIRSFQAQQRTTRRRALPAGDDVIDAEEAA